MKLLSMLHVVKEENTQAKKALELVEILGLLIAGIALLSYLPA